MQPGNLVFLVIVAIWAVYLVQHWIRRREHVATARSVDRFSEAMRVLERRTPLSRAELGAPHPPSYAVRHSSARTALTVKRAPAVSGSSGSSRPSSLRVSSSPTVPRPARELPVRPSARELLVRRVRGVAFLVTLAAIPVTLVLAIADVLLWVSVAIAVAAFVVVVAGLRAAVKRDLSVRRAARTAARRRYAPPGASPASRPTRPTSADWGANASSSAPLHPNPEGVPGSGGERVPGSGGESPSDEAAADTSSTATAANSGMAAVAMTGTAADSGMAAVAASTRPTDEVYDVTAYVARPGEPSTTPWSPVPVPPPTYTLKDAAARPVPDPADVSQVPVPIEVEDDELERLMAQRHRRIVG